MNCRPNDLARMVGIEAGPNRERIVHVLQPCSCLVAAWRCTALQTLVVGADGRTVPAGCRACIYDRNLRPLPRDTDADDVVGLTVLETPVGASVLTR